jgi:hypothetical protein
MQLSAEEELETILAKIEEDVQRSAYQYRYANDEVFRQAEIDRKNAECDQWRKEGRQKILTILLLLGVIGFFALAIYNDWSITWPLG